MSGIDYNLLNETILINLTNLLKLLLVSYFIFYWIPSKVFPQNYILNTMDKVLFNILYSVSFSILIIPQLVFFKLFSMPIYIFILIITKICFIKFYEKKELNVVMAEYNKNIMINIFNFFDNRAIIMENYRKDKQKSFKRIIHTLTIYKLFLKLFYLSLFIFVVSNIGIQSISTFSDASPDNAFYINWLTEMEENILWSDNNSFGSDFYGPITFIFSLFIWSNIDSIILFKIYPILLIGFYHFVLYYVFYKLFNSRFTALFGIMSISLIFYSPLSIYFSGEEVSILNPEIYSIGEIFNFYYFNEDNHIKFSSYIYSHIPYTRFSSGLGYEFSASLFLLNLYFLTSWIKNKNNQYLMFYCLTLFLVFSFHGGGAIFLLPASILILINGFIFNKITFSLLIKGFVSVFITTILGNLWVLSMIKYGLPKKVGNALPILDEYLPKKNNLETVETLAADVIQLINLQSLQFVMIFLLVVMIFLSYLSKKNKFLKSSLILSVSSVFLVFYLPHLSTSRLVAYSRGIEYMFSAYTLILVYFYYYFINYPMKLILKKYYPKFFLVIFYTSFLFGILYLPKWYNINNHLPDNVKNSLYPNNIDSIGYNATAKTLLDINSLYRPFSWTFVSYVQEYAKVKDKGYHINLHNFLKTYDPSSEYLKIPTRYIFLAEEITPNDYKGLSEWWYRWKRDIEDNLRSWISIYKSNNDTIRLYKEGKNINIYIIDNKKYLDYLSEKNKEIKNGNSK